MAIIDLFSKRKAAATGDYLELQHVSLPEKFRVQVVQLLLDGIGRWTELDRRIPPSLQSPLPANDAWGQVFNAIRREHGLFALGEPSDNPLGQCMTFMLRASTDQALDLIEYALRVLDQQIRHLDPYFYQVRTGVTLDPDAVIQEFNARCRENGVGYSYEYGRIIPSSSPYIHSQVVDPALVLVNDEGFRGAQEEFLKAHGHLRRGDYPSAIVDAGKAFESAMKTVCARKRWAYEPTAAAKALVATLLKNGFFPSYMETHLTQLRCLLESGVPVVRNKEGAHGQGPEPVEVPRQVAEYAIHLTAANIVLMVKILGG